MARKIGGLQRLWVLVSGIYLILVIIFVSLTFPQSEQVTDYSNSLYDKLKPESRQKIFKPNSDRSLMAEAEKRHLTTRVRMPNGYIMHFSSGLPQKEIEAVANEYWDIVEAEARKERLRYLFLALLWFIVPVSALYGLGWSLGWVYRGFKGQ
jgi:hypothetical protein